MSDDINVIEATPYNPPSTQLLELLHALEESNRRIAAISAWEFSAEELYGLGELTDLQVEHLLTRGSL